MLLEEACNRRRKRKSIVSGLRCICPNRLGFYGNAWRASMADAMPTSARVMGVTKDLGTIATGKLADMILIDGDPAKNIRDTRNITTVIKGGRVYDPAAIEKAMGIIPRPTRQ